ncbi:MAG: exo-alpha-sialidase [Bacteroidales bacterium]|nr:exo-alpha-sialidase [Bacteroidales bacterium]
MKKILLFLLMLQAATFLQAQWEPDLRLTNDPGISLTSIYNAWCVAASGDTVHAVWYDDRKGNQEIYYKRSTDRGLTWGEDTRLTYALGSSTFPSIAVSGSLVLVTWSDERSGKSEIYSIRSTNGGLGWETEVQLTYADVRALRSSVVISGLAVHIVWHDNRDGVWAIYYIRSDNGGLTWGDDTRLTFNSTYSVSPSIAVSGAFLHIAWREQRDGNDEIYYKNSTDGGLSWGADMRLTNHLTVQDRPSISVSESVVHVVWRDYRDGDTEIYYARSADGGITWGANTRLTNCPGDSQSPSIAVSGNAVHVVWYDDRDILREIYYKRSDDEGLNWSADTRLTYASGDPQDPSIAVSGPVVHVVWTDLRDGNQEIYYKRDPTGGFATGTDDMVLNDSGQVISLSPNPASTRIHIHFNGFLNPQSILFIRNILGEALLSRQIQSDETVIDISNLPNGIYFVEITQDKKQTVIKKLIIRK